MPLLPRAHGCDTQLGRSVRPRWPAPPRARVRPFHGGGYPDITYLQKIALRQSSATFFGLPSGMWL